MVSYLQYQWNTRTGIYDSLDVYVLKEIHTKSLDICCTLHGLFILNFVSIGFGVLLCYKSAKGQRFYVYVSLFPRRLTDHYESRLGSLLPHLGLDRPARETERRFRIPDAQCQHEPINRGPQTGIVMSGQERLQENIPDGAGRHRPSPSTKLACSLLVSVLHHPPAPLLHARPVLSAPMGASWQGCS